MASRTPPNGSRGRPRLTRSDWSMAHIDVGAHHRHLVDDQELEPAHDAAVAAAADVVGADQPRREAEEGMNGLAADVDGGEAGRRNDHHLVGDQVPEAPQQRRLAGAGAASDEQVACALAQEGVCREEFAASARRRRATRCGQRSAGWSSALQGALRSRPVVSGFRIAVRGMDTATGAAVIHGRRLSS